MGTCSSDFMDVKRSAAENLETLFEHSAQNTPILFVIKEWPDRKSIDLRSPADVVTRNLDLTLLPGEKIQITLKNHKREHKLSEEHEGHSPSQVLSTNALHCEIRRNNQFYQFDFPVEREREWLWRFTHGWSEFAEGDVLRMGVTKYRLSRFVVRAEEQLEDLQKTLHPHASTTEESAPRCRICLSTVDSPENPFISPCKCDGSIKFAHLRCLSAWLFSSNLNEQELLTIRTNKTVCELCKTDITGTPEFARMETLLLGNLQDIPAPYAIFESSHLQEQQRRSSRDYFVLSFRNKQDYTFGRGSKADISDRNDAHISKINTELRYANERLSVRDCESLHGTYLQVRGPIRLYQSNVTEQLAFHNMLIRIAYEPAMEKEELEVVPEMNPQSSTKI